MSVSVIVKITHSEQQPPHGRTWPCITIRVDLICAGLIDCDTEGVDGHEPTVRQFEEIVTTIGASHRQCI